MTECLSTREYLSRRNARLAQLRTQIRNAEDGSSERRYRREFEAIESGRAIPLRA